MVNNKWFEVWYVEGVGVIPAYLVVVTPDSKNNSEIVVIDLQDNKTIFRGKSYQDVREWLLEDDFCFVNGRIS